LRAAAKEAASPCQLTDINILIEDIGEDLDSSISLNLQEAKGLKWKHITPDGEVINGSKFKARRLFHGSSYIFRIRQGNAFGWSSLSAASRPLTTSAISEPEPPTLNFPASYYMVISCCPTDKYAAYSTTEYEIQTAVLLQLNSTIINTEPPIWEDASFRQYTVDAFHLPMHQECLELVPYRQEVERSINKGSGLTCPDCGSLGEMAGRNDITHVKCLNCKSVYCYVCGVVDKEASGTYALSTALFNKIPTLNKSETDNKEILFIDSLSPGTTYMFRIRFRTAVGWSPWSDASKPMCTLGLA